MGLLRRPDSLDLPYLCILDLIFRIVILPAIAQQLDRADLPSKTIRHPFTLLCLFHGRFSPGHPQLWLDPRTQEEGRHAHDAHL